MLFMFRFVVEVGGITVMANTCLATIDERPGTSEWRIATLTLVQDDPSVTFNDRPMAVIPVDHCLYPLVTADLLNRHGNEVSAKWEQFRLKAAKAAKTAKAAKAREAANANA